VPHFSGSDIRHIPFGAVTGYDSVCKYFVERDPGERQRELSLRDGYNWSVCGSDDGSGKLHAGSPAPVGVVRHARKRGGAVR